MRVWAREGGILVQVGKQFVGLEFFIGFDFEAFGETLREIVLEIGDVFCSDDDDNDDEKLDLSTKRRKKARKTPMRRSCLGFFNGFWVFGLIFLFLFA